MRSLILFCLLTAAAVARQTSTSPPDAPSTKPAAGSKPSIFTVPPLSSRTLITSQGQAPPPTPDIEEFCHAPAEGIYAARPDPEGDKAQVRELQNYQSIAHQRIETMWEHNMPRAANDPWFRKAIAEVRFAILPSGEIDAPVVTTSSGHASYDHHALEAIRQAAPFGPVPAGIQQPIRICYHFGYHISTEQMQPKAKDPLPYTRPTPQP